MLFFSAKLITFRRHTHTPFTTCCIRYHISCVLDQHCWLLFFPLVFVLLLPSCSHRNNDHYASSIFATCNLIHMHLERGPHTHIHTHRTLCVNGRWWRVTLPTNVCSYYVSDTILIFKCLLKHFSTYIIALSHSFTFSLYCCCSPSSVHSSSLVLGLTHNSVHELISDTMAGHTEKKVSIIYYMLCVYVRPSVWGREKN